MRKHLTKGEIFQAWIAQSQEEAVCSSMSFRRDKFFSYGTAIAAFADNSVGVRAYIINDGQYSGTTSASQNALRDALPKSATVFSVPGWYRWLPRDILDHAANLQAMKEKIDRLHREAAESRAPKSARLSEEAIATLDKRNAYAAFFDITL